MPPTPTTTPETGPSRRPRAFSTTLEQAMIDTGTTQAALAAHVDRSQSTVSGWLSGATTPLPATVFHVESYLGLDPGTLSQHLGYVPVGVRGRPLADLISRDRLLSAAQCREVTELYCAYARC